jgi:serine/threonine-protein kinase
VQRLTPGFVLSARYRLDERVASGGMGQVWSATDSVLQRKVALKVMHPETLEQLAAARRFKAEARFAAQLSHPNIVEVFDFGEHDGLSFLVMEFIEGPTLEQLLADNGPLDAGQVRSILLQLAAALARAHENGIIHRDLKPSNVLISPDGFAKLMDFGIAEELGAQTAIRTGDVLGTTYYVSPEQALGEPLSPRSDLYSLGVLGHELLTGHKPFDRGSPLATALAHLEQQPPPLPPDVPADLAELLNSCLAKDAEERPASATEVARALAAGEPASVPLVLADEDGLLGQAGTPTPPEDAEPQATLRWQPVWRPHRVDHVPQL